jgi:tRNA G10  N-methylase Trm11
LSLNGEIHSWYHSVLGFSGTLVRQLLDEFKIREGHVILDPFCGTGTTLVECKKAGVRSIGIDANPISCLAARVKTTWNLDPKAVRQNLNRVLSIARRNCRWKEKYRLDPTYKYLETSGMIERGWISESPLREAIALKSAIVDAGLTGKHKHFMQLALIAEVVENGSNVKFGPELYCAPKKRRGNLVAGFSNRVLTMARQLDLVRAESYIENRVLQGDSRSCDRILRKTGVRRVHAIITSPPYPTEHDYTRNSRLELALLEHVTSRSDLRNIKQDMIRSHTKGIYVQDDDRKFVKYFGSIDRIATAIDRRTKKKEHGFARLYSTVLREYFGGMRRHFESVHRVLADGGLCAYVVGDQASYLRVHIPAAKILSGIASRVGFETVEIRRWRKRWSTTRRKRVNENILILRKRNPR